MEITEVRIKLMDGAQDRLLGFCSITFDRAFVVRDLKIIKGSRGAFVAMPSRKLTDRCRQCGNKNPLRSVYCSQCGVRVTEHRQPKTHEGKAKLYADIAHPINSECRDLIQHSVLVAYEEELLLSQQPGYVCRYDDFGEYDSHHEDSDRWDLDFARREEALTAENWNSLDDHAPLESHCLAEPANHHSSSHKREGFGEGIL